VYASNATDVAKSTGHPAAARRATIPGKSKPNDIEMTWAFLGDSPEQPLEEHLRRPSPVVG
jgi:hypothetical protein